MAAAWMAMEHFNARDPVVVTELEDPEFQECTITFDMEGQNSTRTAFFDTASFGQQSSRFVFDNFQQNLDGLPCAFVGPFFDIPAMNIAAMAASARVTHIPTGEHDARLGDDFLSPYTTVIYPRYGDIARILGLFVETHQRTNFVATLFAYSDAGISLQEACGGALDIVGVKQRKSFGYWPPIHENSPPGLEMADAMQKVKASGYRTIVVIMDSFAFELPLLADLAEELNMNTKDYVWIFLPQYDQDTVDGLSKLPDSMTQMLNPPVPSYKNVPKLIKGAALIQPVEGFQINPEQDKYTQVWKSINESFVERLNTNGVVINQLFNRAIRGSNCRIFSKQSPRTRFQLYV
jgi:hypothetical protein